MTARPRRMSISVALLPEHAGRRISGLLLIAALIFAPWCWGCAWPAGIDELDLLLFGATLAWLPCAWRDRPPRLFMLAVLAILLQGWLMTLNSRSIYAEATGCFAPLEPVAGALPGSVERDASWETMTRVTALLGAALAACSLGRERVWRGRLAATLIITAVSIVLLGCAQRWSGATDIFWGPRRLDYFFGTYRNVTNAGELINLALPVAAAAAWNARHGPPLRRALAVCAWAILVAGVFVCGSKAAPLVFVATALGFLAGTVRELAWLGTRNRLPIAVVLALAVLLMTWGAGWDVSQDRWTRLFSAGGEVTLGHRLAVDRACLSGAQEAGWLGAGPGTFPAIFPALQAAAADAPDGRWLAAHDDYLQTFLEWGAAGTLAWSIYFLGAGARLVAGLRRSGWRRDDRVQALGVLLALAGVALMASVDFPLQVASLQLEVAVLAGLGWSSSRWPRAVEFRPSKFVLRSDRRLITSPLTRCIDRRCCENDLSGSVDPSTGQQQQGKRRK